MARSDDDGTRRAPGEFLPHDSYFARRRFVRYGLPLLLIAAGLAALTVDVPAAHWFLAGSKSFPTEPKHCPRFVEQICSWAEVFANGTGVAILLITILVLDPAGRRFVPRLAAAAFGSGLLADVFKLSLARERPYHFDFHGGVAETFDGLLPALRRDAGTQSFPSSHVAVAAGLAIALTWRYPRGRWLFPVFVLLAAGQRLTGGSHFVSDVCWGAATGCLFAPICLPGGWLGPLFTRLEERICRQGRAACNPNDGKPASERPAPCGSASHAA